MTTFQDPQPQSRRAVRQSERGESAESTVGFTQFPPTAAPVAPQYYVDPAAPREMWDTTARRAAQLPPTAPRPDAPPAASGRRAAAPTDQPAEPLTYSTQARPVVPSYDGPAFRNRPVPAPSAQPAPVPASNDAPAEQPAFRVRDFSPEARRPAPLAEPGWSPPAPPADLQYHTGARPGYGQPAPQSAEPATSAELQNEHTLSRREFRALQQADAPAAPGPDAYSVPFDQVVAPPALVEPPRAAPATIAPAPVAPAPAPAASAPAQAAPAPAPLPPRAPEPVANTGLTNALTEFDGLTQGQQPSADEPSAWSPPVGHWSSHADHDDGLPESTINRRIGSGTATTNALVLPTPPQGTDIRGPLTSTGEIMLTGSIDLPRNLAATGVTDRFDHDGIDALFDLSDSEVISTDSAPVRAISAVSTHSSGHGVTHTRKPKGTRALTALLIAAASMAVVVAGLLVAAFALNVF